MNPLTQSLIGTALGDSLGLPSEGMSRARIARKWRGALEQRLVFGHGMLSDDTEHTILAAQALIQSGGDPAVFQRKLAAKLRWWFAALPAGVGLATAKSILKLWLGFPPGRNGVFSAGNGPAMRAPIVGVYFAGDAERRRRFVRASTTLTHTDPRALEAAMLAADAAAFAVMRESRWEVILAHLRSLGASPEWSPAFARIAGALAAGHSVEEFAAASGWSRGVSGYALHTMTMVLFIWLRHRGDFPNSIAEAIACGGDTDTIAAIVGGIAGAECGAFPADWTGKLRDQPYSMAYLARLGEALETSHGGGQVAPPPCNSWWRVPRNAFFLLVVLLHGFRRLLPPY